MLSVLVPVNPLCEIVVRIFYMSENQLELGIQAVYWIGVGIEGVL